MLLLHLQPLSTPSDSLYLRVPVDLESTTRWSHLKALFEVTQEQEPDLDTVRVRDPLSWVSACSMLPESLRSDLTSDQAVLVQDPLPNIFVTATIHVQADERGLAWDVQVNDRFYTTPLVTYSDLFRLECK